MGRRAFEFEIKLAGAPKDVARWRGSRRFLKHATGAPALERLASTYFDDAAGTLRKAGATLRLRDEGGQRIQTLKREEAEEGALRRLEEERPLARGACFPAPAVDEGLARLIAAAGDLAPVARTIADRWSATIARNGARLEIAVDLGRFEALGPTRVKRRAPLAEIEIELLEGDAAAAFREARRLVGKSKGALQPRFRSKAFTARRLLADAPYPDDPDVRFDAAAPAGAALAAAFQAAALRLADLHAPLAQLRLPAALHQMRVALRRLRVAQDLISGDCDPERHAMLRKKARRLNRNVAAARDWDVFCDDLLEPLRADGPAALDALAASAFAARAKAWNRAARTVQKAAFGIFVLDLAETALDPGLARAGEGTTKEFAARALERLHSDFCARARACDFDDQAALHRLRLDAKALRYASQMFRPAFDAASQAPWSAALSALQDDLGALTDAAVAQRFADRAAQEKGGKATRAAGFVYGFYAQEAARKTPAIKASLADVAALAPYWRD